MPVDISTAFILAAGLAAFAVGLSKGGLSMIGMLGVPILALVMPPLHATALLAPIYVASDMVGVYLYRHRYSRRNLAILIPAAALGIGVGWATAHLASPRLVTLLIGLIGLAFTLDMFLKRKRVLPPRPADVPRGIVWGAITGFTSFVSHSGAPPFQVYVLPQRLEKTVFAGTTTIVFAVVNAMKLVPYVALGELTAANAAFSLWLLPPALIGTVLGWWLVRILPERGFYLFVQVALFLVSCKLVLDGLMG
ncbi:sulfite exporter TauE/SafE family protein [Aureimonas frigidaquae]|uniref:sulfite exporter TauE/SafE family protein n=1 Tax=Aureimonas frigidaquae TaxID=424757 RepID=UPI000786136B|nr:sulfite exporter TauE/SafE family protein [Aureimonas frigidaquae]